MALKEHNITPAIAASAAGFLLGVLEVANDARNGTCYTASRTKDAGKPCSGRAARCGSGPAR